MKWSKFQNQVNQIWTFFFFSLFPYFFFTPFGKWKWLESVFCWSNIARQVTQGRFLGEKKGGRSYVQELPGWNRWFDDAAIYHHQFFPRTQNKLPAFEADFLLLFFERKTKMFHTMHYWKFHSKVEGILRCDWILLLRLSDIPDLSQAKILAERLDQAILPHMLSGWRVSAGSRKKIYAQNPQMPSSGRNKAWRSCSGTNMNNTPWIRSDFLKKLGHWGGWASFHEFFQQSSQRFRCTSGFNGTLQPSLGCPLAPRWPLASCAMWWRSGRFPMTWMLFSHKSKRWLDSIGHGITSRLRYR